MKINKNFVLREVAGTFLVVAVGDAVKTFNKVINLNETGAFLWKQLENNVTKEQLVEALTAEYKVDRQEATKDIEGFIEGLKQANILE